ncbi:hypothetical protein HSRCO_0732 [Halanaeroarchaeum sp. HSR-CO]|uniref:C2H2-type zinc finger protein n=1 Tax=Halanaeroarchaeum sp. HSR-CO TaxID=2866382 RepID=UPI00217EC8FE|nr:C2H2-type zinc finger protein [Halanaeroarchaeum sp. HSR-CO]UWG47026.1 hypothetical protein HSRCO_0732 [Halanaeroarchaeum sp. HSR-CO]
MYENESAGLESRDATDESDESDIIVAGDGAEIIADGGLLECPDCEKTFVRESSLKQHQFLADHGGDDE